MILYRVVWLKFLTYCGLDDLFKEDPIIAMLRKRKKKEPHKTKLLIDEDMLFYVSLIMSIAVVLIFLSIPFVALQSPCDIFIEHQYYKLYVIASAINNHFYIVDTLIILLLIALAYVFVDTILDAIERTNINISPWVERGKYTLPEKGSIIIKEESPEVDFTRLLFERSRNIIVNGRYYEQCGGFLREKKLEEYKNRIIELPKVDSNEMSYHELVMFEKQHELYINRVMNEKKMKEKLSGRRHSLRSY